MTLVISAAASSPDFTLAVTSARQTVTHGGTTGATVAVLYAQAAAVPGTYAQG